MAKKSSEQETINLEVTTHNYYFHDQASIFSLDCNGKILVTGGGDNDIRIWKIVDEKKSHIIGNNEHKKDIFSVKENKNNTSDALLLDDIVTDENNGNSLSLKTDQESNKKTANTFLDQNKNNDFPGQDLNENDIGKVSNLILKTQNNPINISLSHKYTTALNSTIKLEYIKELQGHSKSVNCVRFFGEYIVSAGDGGKIILWDNDNSFVVREADGNDIYDILCIDGHIFAGLSNGNICVYKIIMDVEFSAINVQTLNTHADMVQGLAYNKKHRLLISFCKDKTAKLFLFSEKLEYLYTYEFIDKAYLVLSGVASKKFTDTYMESLCQNDSEVLQADTEVDDTKKTQTQNLEGTPKRPKNNFTASDKHEDENIFEHEHACDNSSNKSKKQPSVSRQNSESVRERVFSNGRGFFKRTCFSDDGNFLYLCCFKTNSVLVISYPFRIEHIYCKIGPLNEEAVCIGENNGILYICTKKTVYAFRDFTLLFCIENFSFMAITDISFYEDIVFVSSLDGFLASFRYLN